MNYASPGTIIHATLRNEDLQTSSGGLPAFRPPGSAETKSGFATPRAIGSHPGQGRGIRSQVAGPGRLPAGLESEGASSVLWLARPFQHSLFRTPSGAAGCLPTLT